MVKISDSNGLEARLAGRPREVAVAIAARAALRMLPHIADYVEQAPADLAVPLALSMFRAVAVAQVSSTSLTRGAQVRRPARSAANAVHSARAAAVGGPVLIRAPTAQAAIAAANAAAAAARATRAAALAAAAALDTARAAADAAVRRTIHADISVLDTGGTAPGLKRLPLWADGAPAAFRRNWADLKQTLLSLGDNWQVWTDWYDDILRGADHPDSRPLIEELELARVLIPDADWEKGPNHVNALIVFLEMEHRRPPDPDEIEPQDPSAAQFQETDYKIDADDLAGQDAVATDPIARDLHDGALAFARIIHELVADAPHGSNRPRMLATTVVRLIEATGTTVDATRPGLLIPLAAALQVALDADARRERDPDLEGSPLSADEREAVVNANNAYKTWINTDRYLATLEGARLRKAEPAINAAQVSVIVNLAVEQSAATPSARDLVEEAAKAGPESQYFAATALNFFRRGLKIATAIGTSVARGAKVAAWLVTNADKILSLLRPYPGVHDVAKQIIDFLRKMPLDVP